MNPKELKEYGAGSYIEESVSEGPKNYAFSVFCPATEKRSMKCKVKGMALNCEKSQVLNFSQTDDSGRQHTTAWA